MRPTLSISYGWLASLLALALTSACAHASTAARIRRLDAEETKLRGSVELLERRQSELRRDIVKAQAEAAEARCQAEAESYRAVVASIFAEYSVKVAEHKGCTASASKNGGALMVAGCGIAAFMTGGLALAVCGGSVAAGYVMSESCDGPPQGMTAEDVRLRAEAATGYSRQPSCTDPSATFAAKRGYQWLRSPYGATSTFNAGAADPDKSRKHARQAKRSLRKLEKQRRKSEKKRSKDEKRQQRNRRNKGDALDW